MQWIYSYLERIFLYRLIISEPGLPQIAIDLKPLIQKEKMQSYAKLQFPCLHSLT
jgi:hypothetical protein